MGFYNIFHLYCIKFPIFIQNILKFIFLDLGKFENVYFHTEHPQPSLPEIKQGKGNVVEGRSCSVGRVAGEGPRRGDEPAAGCGAVRVSGMSGGASC